MEVKIKEKTTAAELILTDLSFTILSLANLGIFFCVMIFTCSFSSYHQYSLTPWELYV